MSYQLNFFQTFNAMRVYLSMHFDKHPTDNLGVILGSLRLFKYFPEWQESPETWDPAAWQDWMDGVNKTMQDLNIKTNHKHLVYNPEIAFLCMKNFLQLFYNEIPYEDIGGILEELNNSQTTSSDVTWKKWLQAIDHSINETYLLDEPLGG